MKKELKKGGQEFFRIFDIIRKEKFVGYTGLAIKNSLYQIITSTTTKIASLVFVIILARMLLPELFGLYSLALSTILLFALISDLGTGYSLVYFVSKKLVRGQESKAKGYAAYILKIKLLLTFVAAIFLAMSAKFIADSYYQKPIFLALLAGAFYIFFSSAQAFVTSLFRSVNKFKEPFIKELFFQVTRLIIIPLVVLFSIKELAYSPSRITFLIILSLAFVYFLTFILILILSFRNVKFIKAKIHKTTLKENKKIRNFTIGLSAITLSALFFGYIDMFLLGHFVSSSFIGYYAVAFSIMGSSAIILVFSNVLFPIFARIGGKRLKRAFNKSFRIVLTLSIIAFLAILLFAPLIVKIIFGDDYLPAVPLLRLLSLLVISLPLTELYNSYLISRGNTKDVRRLILTSIFLNIVLTYLFITWLLDYGQLMATMGAAIATIISRYFYLGGIIFAKKKFDKRVFKKSKPS
jgi:O-antigen/teichoic acid export membrane protein